MLVAVLALGTIASVTALQDTAQAQIDSTAGHIGSRRSAVTTTPPPSPVGGGGATATTAAPTTAPPTTAAPTTAAPPEPAPPTTAPTTTLAPATFVQSTWGPPIPTRSGNEWNARVSLDIRDDNNEPVSGATVRMVIEYPIGGDQWKQLIAPFEAVTTASGALTVTSPWVTRNGNGSVGQLRFSVTSVTAPGLTWATEDAQVVAGRP